MGNKSLIRAGIEPLSGDIFRVKHRGLAQWRKVATRDVKLSGVCSIPAMSEFTNTLRPGRLAELQSHLMLVFSGKQRIAAEIAKTKMANMDRHRPDMHRMAQMVNEAIAILTSDQPITDFGSLLHEAWTLKRNLSPAVSTSEIDDMYAEARAAGAIGGKVLGAGGGGFMLLFAKPEHQENIRARLKKIHVPLGFDTSGSRVVLYQPAGL